jgi:hypothetical protein
MIKEKDKDVDKDKDKDKDKEKERNITNYVNIKNKKNLQLKDLFEIYLIKDIDNFILNNSESDYKSEYEFLRQRNINIYEKLIENKNNEDIYKKFILKKSSYLINKENLNNLEEIFSCEKNNKKILIKENINLKEIKSHDQYNNNKEETNKISNFNFEYLNNKNKENDKENDKENEKIHFDFSNEIKEKESERQFTKKKSFYSKVNLEDKEKNPNINPNFNINNKPNKKISLERRPYLRMSLENLKLENEKNKKKIEEINERNKDNFKKEKEMSNLLRLEKKWKKIAQDACYEILSHIPENIEGKKNDLNTLLNYFRIDKSKLDFDEENNEFLE